MNILLGVDNLLLFVIFTRTRLVRKILQFDSWVALGGHSAVHVGECLDGQKSDHGQNKFHFIELDYVSMQIYLNCIAQLQLTNQLLICKSKSK